MSQTSRRRNVSLHPSENGGCSKGCLKFQSQNVQMFGYVFHDTHDVTGDHLFVISATCLLLSCFDVSDVSSHVYSLITVWLKANQSVCTHEMSYVCFVTEKEIR